MLAIPALWKLRQKASLGYIARPCVKKENE
jgi:hypothetical protein